MPARLRPARWTVRARLTVPAAAAAITALTVALTSCGSSSSGGSGAAGATGSGSARAGGILRIAADADPGCLDPQQTGQLQTLDVARGLVDSLTDQDPKTGAIVPWLAKSWTISPDAKQFTFVLRTGATFSDGSPVDGQAVKATFDRLSKLPPNGAPAYIKGYTGTTVTDATHVTVGFSQPNSQFLQATSTTGFGILSVATASRPLADRCRGQYVGSGPFVLKSYTPNRGVTIARRAGYAWASARAVNTGTAHLDEVDFTFVSEDGARTGSLSSGQAQIGENIQPSDQDQFDGGSASLLRMSAPGLVPPLSLNHRGILADERVRQALLKGIDRSALVSTVFNASYKPATSVLSSTTPLYVNQKDKLGFDRAGSEKLLTEAGWAPGKDGIRVKDGKSLALTWLIPAPMPPADEAVQQQLRTIGVDVRLQAVPPAQYVSKQNAGEFDITAVGVTRADPDVLRNIFSTKGSNLWHLTPSVLDTYLEQEVTATNQADRQHAVTAAVTWILDHADTVPLYENAVVHGVSTKVHGLLLTASTQLDLHEAWLG
ncbi:peptide/nickel transport system substrate-binding protein [Frankia sp. AiPs1]|uniref:ABC transporter substrate-binding protein n=1 Tax=Frankia sp. AiPa1 TaxID=573492 RepID=UPI00202AE096|nr:ABC transporter substrate-binding protein [Frankia sp. AiPa1]MCL9759329.1 ABC transporter substrate-binding protein [Frankia sp. AiPa1]